MKGVNILCGLSIIVLLLTTCEPKPTLEARVQNMVVRTVADNTINFSSYATYSLAIDTVGVFWSFDPDTVIVDEYSSLVSRAVKTNLDNAGFKLVGPKQNPDWGVNVFLVRGYNVDQTFISPNYYFRYPGNFKYSYSGYGGYSRFPYVTLFYTSSALWLVEIIDLKNIDAQQRVKIIWTAFMGDADASPNPLEKSKEAVDQAFKQSPYIRK